jgi:glycerol-3-phosphate dehydrogenase
MLCVMARRRDQTIAGLEGRHFDAVVIGGGINGAGVARDATLRGLSVCLLEQGDFASGTSSKSTKIAHGGLRYLKQLEFGLVFESQQERRVLRRLLPHLVTPQSFCYPVYRGDPDPLWKVRLGLTMYDLLATFRNVYNHRHLSATEALAANPSLRREGLLGAVRYWDDRMEDARICIETVLSAARAGAVCINYCRVTAVSREGEGYRIAYEDVLSGAGGSVTARAVVNCAGPWADAVSRLADSGSLSRLAPTKGVHIVVPRLPLEDALILGNPDDGRTFFVIPWEDRSLIGTTDTRYEGDPSAVKVEDADIDYLLAAARRYLEGPAIERASISYSFAGLRPLVAPRKPGLSEGRISRRHLLHVSPPAFLTLIGGKYTTFRRMAEQATDRLIEDLGRPKVRCATRTTPYFADAVPSIRPGAADTLWEHLRASYGPRAAEVYDFCRSDERLQRRVVDSSPVVLGQLAYALLYEDAVSLADLVLRRTRLCWQPDFDAAAARRTVEALAPYFIAGIEGAMVEAEGLEEMLGRRRSAAVAPDGSP